MKTLLTVDWDFFVKEKPEWDLGHRENLLFLNMVWGTRGGLYGLIKTSGQEIGFWDKLRAQARFEKKLWVSDSHCFAYSLTKGVDRVVLFDAHHDCWPSSSGEKGVFCENWLRIWLGRSKKRRATWVRPDWQDACELLRDMTSRVDVVQWRDDLDLGITGPTVAHACRSGCWVPPWLDGAFLGFLRAFKGSLDAAMPMQDGDWNPLRERWTAEELAKVLENERKFKEFAVGHINSGKFLNSGVEISSVAGH